MAHKIIAAGATGQVIRLHRATWESIGSLYLDECGFRRLSDRTIEDKAWWLEKFTASSCPAPHELTSAHVTSFVSTYKNGATAHKAFTVIAAFCKWLLREGWLESNPCAGLAAPKEPKVLIPLFEPSDVEKLLKVAAGSKGFTGARDAAVIMTLYDTGIRVSELCSVTDPDLDLAGRRLLVHGKGDKERTVYFGLQTRKLLTNYLTAREAALAGLDVLPCRVLVSTVVTAAGSTMPLTPNYVAKMIRRHSRAAGVRCKRPSPHTLRHTFAVQFLRGGGSVFALQRLLGHETLEMTRRYVQLADADLKEAHAMASPGDKLSATLPGSGRRRLR